MVRQPYFSSPGISCISLIASRIKELINAKAAYKIPIRMILLEASAIAGDTSVAIFISAIQMINITQAVSTAIIILPDNNFLLRETEYPNNKSTQIKFPRRIYHSPVFHEI